MSFFEKINKFNEMYKMPEVEPGDEYNRLGNFLLIAAEELLEGEEVLANINNNNGVATMEDKVAVADLLGDVIVYCASEARRWNIDIEQVLNIIMESNFSKLGADGKPIYDERGKLLKGPNFFKPEAKIEELLNKSKG